MALLFLPDVVDKAIGFSEPVAWVRRFVKERVFCGATTSTMNRDNVVGAVVVGLVVFHGQAYTAVAQAVVDGALRAGGAHASATAAARATSTRAIAAARATTTATAAGAVTIATA